MKKYTKIKIETSKIREIECDICHKSFSVDVNEDLLEVQEFHCIDFVGGYGSVFGDDNKVKCDICQHCLDRMLGPYLRISANETFV